MACAPRNLKNPQPLPNPQGRYAQTQKTAATAAPNAAPEAAANYVEPAQPCEEDIVRESLGEMPAVDASFQANSSQF
jgi:hypothetical protein